MATQEKIILKKTVAAFLFLLLVTLGFYGCCPKDKNEPAPEEQVTVPQKVLLYYGYPSLANGANWNINNAMGIFNEFDIIVLGYGLQNPGHDEHNNARQLISYLVKNGKKVYGYIPLGLTEPRPADTRLTDRSQIEREIDKWRATGVTGIFGDEMESGFGVDRTRQNYLINYAHSIGLSIIANGYAIDELLGGKDVKLGAGDYYFLESFGIKAGNYDDINRTISRGNKAREYKKKLGIGVITGGRDAYGRLDNNTGKSDKFLHSYFATLLFNFDGFSYSDFNYSASGGNESNIMIIPKVVPFYGNKLRGGKVAVREGNTYVTYTDQKKVILSEKSGHLE